MTDAKTKVLKRNYKKPINIEQYCLMSEEERKEYSKGVFSEEERLDVEEAIKCMPLIDVKVE